MTARAILSIDAACSSCDAQGGRAWYTRGSVTPDPQTNEVCEQCEGGRADPVAFCERSGVPVDECVGCREEATRVQRVSSAAGSRVAKAEAERYAEEHFDALTDSPVIGIESRSR